MGSKALLPAVSITTDLLLPHLRKRKSISRTSLIIQSDNLELIEFQAGEAVDAGSPVSLQSDGKIYKALINSADGKPAHYIAFNSASADGIAKCQKSGQIAIEGAMFEVGKTIKLSLSGGMTTDIEALTSGHFFQELGIAASANKIEIQIGRAVKII